MQRVKLDLVLHTIHTKPNPGWVPGVNVGVKAVELLEENAGANLCSLGLCNGFMDTPPKA